jgi:hypothetical protein
MSLSDSPQPIGQADPTLSRRVVLAVGGGIGLAAFLSACGAGQPPSTAVPPVAAAEDAETAAEAATLPRHVRITTTGETFNPSVELTEGSKATVSWTVEGGGTMTGTHPVIRFEKAAVRHVRMSVDDGGADALDSVETFNLGFSHRDDEGVYNMGARHNKAPEAVRLVEHVSLLTGLVRFAAAHTTIAGSLDFTGCSRLQYIECIDSNVRSVNVAGCTSLIRLVVEKTRLTTLNLNPVAANLRDLRAAAQQGGTLTLVPLTAPMAKLYHFCVRDQVLVNHPNRGQLPVVRERWEWNTAQSGALTSGSSAIRSLQATDNQYTSADLTHQFPSGRQGTLLLRNNRLTAVTLTGCSGLYEIDLSHNRLNTAAVDTVLAVAASWGTAGGILRLTDNNPPSPAGVSSAAALTGRGWTVTTA